MQPWGYRWWTVCVLICIVLGMAHGEEVVNRSFVDEVWAGHRVGFCLWTEAPDQFVAYYNRDRSMVVARRSLPHRSIKTSPGVAATSHDPGFQAGSSSSAKPHRRFNEWERVVLPERVGWDSHNYITMAMDRDHYLHVSGNMHCVPLVYFRGRSPRAVSGLERIPAMTGLLEGRCTYPVFFRGVDDVLLFMYRDGGSGNGDQIINQYDEGAGQWRRLLDRPLTSGGGLMNAYIHGPVMGPDGDYHMCWVWRDTPDCATNHDLCYARSKDLVQWTDSSGVVRTLPMTVGTAEIVDPVPAGGGMINGNTKIGFDCQGRVVITYHKYDGDGNTQIYAARRESGGWKIYQISDWDIRWEFSGGGSIPFLVQLEPVVTGSEEGLLELGFRHWEKGSGVWILDEATMRVQAEGATDRRYPVEAVLGGDPTMRVNWAADKGVSPEAGIRYALRWESRGVNRDRPQGAGEEVYSRLEVVALRD